MIEFKWNPLSFLESFTQRIERCATRIGDHVEDINENVRLHLVGLQEKSKRWGLVQGLAWVTTPKDPVVEEMGKQRIIPWGAKIRWASSSYDNGVGEAIFVPQLSLDKFTFEYIGPHGYLLDVTSGNRCENLGEGLIKGEINTGVGIGSSVRFRVIDIRQ